MTSGGLAAVSSSAFAALYSAFGKYDVVHIHAEGPAFFAWLPKMFGKRVVVKVLMGSVDFPLKNHLVLDEEVSDVVVRIFLWKKSGMKEREIAKKLSVQGIQTPFTRRCQLGIV